MDEALYTFYLRVWGLNSNNNDPYYTFDFSKMDESKLLTRAFAMRDTARNVVLSKRELLSEVEGHLS